MVEVDLSRATPVFAPHPSAALLGIADGLFLDDRTVVIGDRFDKQVKVFDMADGFIAALGGEGSGPGEIQVLRALSRVDQTRVAVWDPQLLRLTVFRIPVGEVETISPRFDGFRSTIPSFVGSAGALGWIFQDADSPDTAGAGTDGLIRQTVRFVRLSEAGADPEVLAEVEGDERFLRTMRTVEGVPGIRTGGLTPVVLGSRLFASTASGELVLARSDSVHILRFSPLGVQVAERFSAGLRAPISEADAEHVRRRTLDSIQRGPERYVVRSDEGRVTGREVQAEAWLAAPVATFAPEFTALVVAADGSVWMRRFKGPASESQEWWQFDETLTLRMRVSLPTELRVLDFHGPQMLAVQRGPLGQETPIVIPI